MIVNVAGDDRARRWSVTEVVLVPRASLEESPGTASRTVPVADAARRAVGVGGGTQDVAIDGAIWQLA